MALTWLYYRYHMTTLQDLCNGSSPAVHGATKTWRRKLARGFGRAYMRQRLADYHCVRGAHVSRGTQHCSRRCRSAMRVSVRPLSVMPTGQLSR